MRYLKNRIRLAEQRRANMIEPKHEQDVPKIEPKIEVKQEPTETRSVSFKFEAVQPRKRAKAPTGETLTPVKSLCTKNIVKNYGKAICNFSFSSAAQPYIQDILKREKFSINLEDFLHHLNSKKDSIDSIQSLKELLMIYDDDSNKLKAFKTLYRLIGEVFIKYFSVNWIYNGRLTYKEAHIKFRNKMLRRLQHPQLFTHIKAFTKKQTVETSHVF